MFCNQCEQTAKGIGCNIAGVCGKNEEVADLQDLLIHGLQGLALFAQEGRKKALSMMLPISLLWRPSFPP